VLLCHCHWWQRLQLASSGVVCALLFKQLQGALVQRDIQCIQLPAGGAAQAQGWQARQQQANIAHKKKTATVTKHQTS
jgi:hypothetical protein